jgi:ParB family chromosome partitioning protein
MSATATAPVAAAPGTFQTLPIDQIDESPLNTRRHFDPKSIDELAASIRAHGVLTPILLRSKGKRYEIAAGARRIRAAKKAKLTEVPAIVRPMDDVQFLEVITIENLQREDVHPLDEALGYKALIERAGYDPQQIADRIGKSLSYVYQRMQLAKLIPDAQKLFSADTITASHAVLIARLQPADQKRVVGAGLFSQHYVNTAGDVHGDGEHVRAVVSVRELETWIRLNVLLDLHSAPWRKDDATLLPQAGPCTTCPKRVGNQPQLFPDVKRGDICTDPACFAAKMTAFFDRKVAELEADTKKPALKLSTSYGGRQKTPGILYEDQWRSAAHEKCKHTVKGVIIETNRWDRGGYHVGQVVDVCAERSCKVHRGKYLESPRASAARDAAATRQKRELQLRLQVRGAILDAVLEQVPMRLPLPLLRLVTKGFLDDVWYEFRKQIARRHHVEPEKPKGKPQRDGADWDGVLDKLITGATEQQLHKLLLETALIKEVASNNGYYRGSRNQLQTVAKELKVNTSKIERQLRADAAAKAKRAAKMNKAKARSKKSQTSAKAGARR